MAFINLFEGDVIGSILKLELAHYLDFSRFNPVDFRAGKSWQEIEFIPESGELRMKVEHTDHGQLFTYSGPFSINKMRDDVETLLFPYIGQQAVLRITDLNYRVYIIGSPVAPVTLEVDATTGRQYTNQNGYNFSFSISQIHRALAV